MSPALTFLTRIATSTVLIGLTGWVLFRLPPIWMSLEVLIFAELGLFEFFQLMKKQEIPLSPSFGLAMGAVIPAVVYLELGYTQSGEILFLVFGCLFLFVLKFFHRLEKTALAGIALTLFGILYVSWFLSFLIKIRFLAGGVVWVAYLIAVTKAADIGAYCSGTLMGRHPLIPHVSPKKSVEGLIGGLASSVAVSAAIGPYLPISFSTGHVLLLGLVIGALGQIGDLSESLMKRCCGAKDSGEILPGMGGVMDAVDSVLFTAPIFYFHLKIYL